MPAKTLTYNPLRAFLPCLKIRTMATAITRLSRMDTVIIIKRGFNGTEKIHTVLNTQTVVFHLTQGLKTGLDQVARKIPELQNGIIGGDKIPVQKSQAFFLSGPSLEFLITDCGGGYECCGNSESHHNTDKGVALWGFYSLEWGTGKGIFWEGGGIWLERDTKGPEPFFQDDEGIFTEIRDCFFVIF